MLQGKQEGFLFILPLVFPHPQSRVISEEMKAMYFHGPLLNLLLLPEIKVYSRQFCKPDSVQKVIFMSLSENDSSAVDQGSQQPP